MTVHPSDLHAVSKLKLWHLAGIPHGPGVDIHCPGSTGARHDVGSRLDVRGKDVLHRHLGQMGANIVLADPHRFGRGPLSAPRSRNSLAQTSAPGRPRHGRAVATGQAEIDHIELIDRGYERIDERLQGLGRRSACRLTGLLCRLALQLPFAER